MASPSFADIAPAIDHFSRGLLDNAIRSLALCGLVSLAALSLRRASAATKHWVWLMGFVGLIFLPLLSRTLPGWHILPPVSFRSPVTNRSVPLTSAPAQARVINPALSPQSPQYDRSTANAAIVTPPTIAAHGSVPALEVDGQQILQQSTVSGQIVSNPDIRLAVLSWTDGIALVWLVGSVIVLSHLLLGYLALWLLQRRCTPIDDPEWQEQLNRLRQMLGVRRGVHLLSVPDRVMPMTWGIRRAKLLLPEDAAKWTPEQRKDVLLHELGHVLRFDCATQLLAQIACSLYWFNPLVWIARCRIQVERERACDDIVLKTGASASTYARHLLQSATAMPAPRFVAAALAMARASTLESRLRTILDSGRNRRTLSGIGICMMLGLMLAILVPVAGLHAQENHVMPPPANPTWTPTITPSFAAATRPSEGLTCALNATIYDVRISATEIGTLDVDALNKAAGTPADFERALSSLGATRPLYRTDQTVRLASDTIMISTQTPIVTGSHTNSQGDVINDVTYQQTGAIFNIAGKSDADDKVDFDLQIRLSTISDSNTATAPNTKASVIRAVTMSHKGAVAAKTPFVVLTADAASTDEHGMAVVYVARVTIGTPQ